MKKFFYGMLLVLFALTTQATSCFAQDSTATFIYTKPTVAVVFVGANEFQAPTFYNAALEQLAKKFDPDLYTVSATNELQKNAQKFWATKGIPVGQVVSTNDLLSFAQTIHYDYVLFFSMNQPKVQTQTRGVKLEQTTAEIEVQSLYSNNKQQTIISSLSTSQRDDSYWGANRALKGAFEKALEYIVGNLNTKESSRF